MKWRTLVFGVALTAEVALALWPVIPGLKELLPDNPTPRAQLNFQIFVIGTGFTLLTIAISEKFRAQERKHEEFRSFIQNNFPVTNVVQLRDDEFYPRFLYAAQTAASTVNIMYMAPHPPGATEDEARLDYYSSMLGVIRRRKEVKFNRIVRDTQENREWIQTLIRELSGCANASLAALKDNKSDEMPLSLSTQIVDTSKVWLVAVSAHERRGTYRDLFIENPRVAEAMQFYFDRLWDRGSKLLDAGRITPEGTKFLVPRN